MSFRKGLKNIWKKLKTYWVTNLGKNIKKISAAIGGLLVYMGISFYAVLTGSLNLTDWLIGGYQVFAGGLFTITIFSMFGKEEVNGNELEKKEAE